MHGPDALRCWLYRRIPRPHPQAANAQAIRPDRIVVLCKGPNPTYDYYLHSRLRHCGIPFQKRCVDTDPLDDIDPRNLLVIICRYIHRRQLRWIARNRATMAGVVYFIDDDIPAMLAEPDAELSYKLWLAYSAILPMPRLNRLLSHCWVSTPGLAQRLAGATGRHPAVLSPAPPIEEHLPLERPKPGELTIAYHATNIHRREHEFLVPILTKLAKLRPHVRLEIIARGRSRALWERAPIPPAMLQLVAPRPWDEYRSRSREQGADILLIPLLDGVANESRATTKLIDCCRLGAAAIASNAPAYAGEHDAGITLVDNLPEEWLAALLEMVDRADLRRSGAASVQARVRGMAADASFPIELEARPDAQLT